MLGMVAGTAVCVWLFRLGMVWGIVGLSVAKHVLVAYLCQVLGVDRGKDGGARASFDARVARPPIAVGAGRPGG